MSSWKVLLVDDEKEMVIVRGKREVPWSWRMQGAISNVKVLIGKEGAVRGEDYEVDEAGLTRTYQAHVRGFATVPIRFADA